MSMPYRLLLEQEREQQRQQREQQQQQQHQQNWLEHGQIAQSTATLQQNSSADNYLMTPSSCLDQQQQQQLQRQPAFQFLQDTDLQQLPNSENDDVLQFLVQYGDGAGDGLHISGAAPFASDNIKRQMQKKSLNSDENSLTELFSEPSSSQSAALRACSRNYMRHIETQAMQFHGENLFTNTNTSKLVLSDPEEFPTLSGNMHKKKKLKSRQQQLQQNNGMKCQFFFETEPPAAIQQQQQQQQQQQEKEQLQQFANENVVNEPSGSSGNQSASEQQNPEQNEPFSTYFANNRHYAYGNYAAEQLQRIQRQHQDQIQQQQQQQQLTKQIPNFNNNQFETQYYQRPNGYYQQHPFRKQRQQSQQHEHHGYYILNQQSLQQPPPPQQQYLPHGGQMDTSAAHFLQQQDALYNERPMQQAASLRLPPPTPPEICLKPPSALVPNEASNHIPDNINARQPANSNQPQTKVQYSDLFKNLCKTETAVEKPCGAAKIKLPPPKKTTTQSENSMDVQAIQLPEAFNKDMLSCLCQDGDHEFSCDEMRLQYLRKQASKASHYYNKSPPPPPPPSPAPLPTEHFHYPTQNDTSAAATVPNAFNQRLPNMQSSQYCMPHGIQQQPPPQHILQQQPPHVVQQQPPHVLQHQPPHGMQRQPPHVIQHQPPPPYIQPEQPNCMQTIPTNYPLQMGMMPPQPIPFLQQYPQNFMPPPAAVNYQPQNLMYHAVPPNLVPQNRFHQNAALQNEPPQPPLQPTIRPFAQPPQQQQADASVNYQQPRAAHWRTIISAEDVNTFLNTYEQQRQQQQQQREQIQQAPLVMPPLLSEPKKRIIPKPATTQPPPPPPPPPPPTPPPQPPQPPRQRPQIVFRPEENIVTNIPSTMLNDQYGIAGLYAAIKRAETNPSLAEMVFGIDPETLHPSASRKSSSRHRHHQQQQQQQQHHQPVLPLFDGPFAGEEELPNTQYRRFPSPTPSSNEAQAGSFSESLDSNNNNTSSDNTSYSLYYGYPLRDFVRESLTPPNMFILTDEQLFLVFYTQVGDLAQLLAAEELYNREWGYYLLDRIWIKHYREFSYARSNGHYERGYYMYFDAINWGYFTRYMKVDLDQIDRPPCIPEEYRERF